MFVTTFPVLPEEVEYLRQEVSLVMPRRRHVTLTITAEHDAFTDETHIKIQCDEPLSIEQRKFLTSCGFSYFTSFVEM